MVASILIATLAVSSPAPSPTPITVAHYSIEIPLGYEARDVSPPMMDFDLYSVTRQGSKRAACTLYFGNHPQFPKLRWWGRKPVETKSDRRTTKAFQRSDAIEGVVEFSGLTYKSSGHSPWTLIHYFCDGLDEAEIRDMLGMIGSIKVVQPHVE
jgi:hypothetical protein